MVPTTAFGVSLAVSIRGEMLRMLLSSRFIEEKADTHAPGIRLLNWNLFYSTTSFESSLIALATLNRFGDVAQTAS